MTKKSQFTTYGAICIAFLLGAIVPAKAKNSTPCGYNVTSIIADTDTNNIPFQLQSDTLGSYVTYTKPHSTDQATSVIQANSCDWLLDLSSSASRTVRLTLAYPDGPISTNPPSPFTGTENIAPRILSSCLRNPANNVTYGTMTYAGQALECAFSFTSFSYGGNTYQLHMNPELYPGTTWAQVKCNSAPTGVCNSWTVFPVSPGPINSTTGQNTAIGELFLSSTNNRLTSIGLYEVAFYITITNP